MKSILLLFLLGMCFIHSVKAQTTWDEYNYVIYNYQAYVTQGIAIKQGYKAKPVSNETITFGDGNEYIKVWLTALHRNSTNKVAAYIVSYQLQDKANTMEHYCIPHPDSQHDILTAYLKTLYSDNKYTIRKLQAMLYTVSLKLKW